MERLRAVRRLSLIAALCSCAFGLGACGGSGLSRSDLAGKADVICARTSRVLERSRQLGSSTQARAQALADAAAARQRELNALRRLTPPSELSESFFRYISNEANVIAGLTTAKVRAGAGHLAAAEAVLEFAAGSRGRMRAAARHLGWRECRRDL